MSHTYTHTEKPDPEMAARERAHVRARNREEHPLWSRAIDSVISADLPLDDAADLLMRLRVRNMRSRQRSRAAR
jgi:hypothetical protein